MPDWASMLLTYGPLGLFAYWVFVIAIPAVWTQLFSRDESKLGLVVAKFRASTARDEKMGVFIDKLDQRDDRQEKLAELHANSLQAMSGVLGDHHAMSKNTHDCVGSLKEAALLGCQACRLFVEREHPNCQAEMEPYLSKIERIIGEG